MIWTGAEHTGSRAMATCIGMAHGSKDNKRKQLQNCIASRQTVVDALHTTEQMRCWCSVLSVYRFMSACFSVWWGHARNWMYMHTLFTEELHILWCTMRETPRSDVKLHGFHTTLGTRHCVNITWTLEYSHTMLECQIADTCIGLRIFRSNGVLCRLEMTALHLLNTKMSAHHRNEQKLFSASCTLNTKKQGQCFHQKHEDAMTKEDASLLRIEHE